MSRATTVIATINIPFKPEWEEETAKILGRAVFPDVNIYSELDKPFVQLTGKRSSLTRLLQYLHSADSAKFTPYSRAEPKARGNYNPARQLSSRGEKVDMLLLDIEANSVGAGKSYHGNVLKDTKRISRTLLGQSAEHDVCVDIFEETRETRIRRFFVFEGSKVLWKEIWYKLYVNKSNRIYYGLSLG